MQALDDFIIIKPDLNKSDDEVNDDSAQKSIVDELKDSIDKNQNEKSNYHFNC